MSYPPAEQAVHDRINLLRLVKRLEKSVESEEWREDTRVPSRAAWIKTQGTLQKLKYAKSLLKNVPLNYELDETSSSTNRLDELRGIIDKLEHVVQDVNTRVTPKPVRPSILEKIPLPAPSARIPTSVSEGRALSVPPSLDPIADLAAQDLLLSPSDTLPSSTLPADLSSALPDPEPLPLPLPPQPASNPTAGASSSAPKPSFLQNSRAVQDDLSAQLAAMATQLRLNAQHFASSLDKDKAIVLEAQEKMERNYDVMKKERVRLRDHRAKSWGTTWITILSLIVVVIGFLLSFFVIRLTR